MPKTLYHWTHRGNLDSIAVLGLDPAFAEGRMAACWVCERKCLCWAMGHVAQRHGWSPDDLILLAVPAAGIDLKRTHMPGVFNVREVIPAGPGWAVRTDLLAEWENLAEALRVRTREPR